MLMKFRVGGGGPNKPTEEEEEAFRSGIIARSFQISAMKQNFVDPFKGVTKFVPPSMCVEEIEDINAYNRVETRS